MITSSGIDFLIIVFNILGPRPSIPNLLHLYVESFLSNFRRHSSPITVICIQMRYKQSVRRTIMFEIVLSKMF